MLFRSALITDDFSLKAGYAYMSQYIHLLSSNAIALPTDLWVGFSGNDLGGRHFGGFVFLTHKFPRRVRTTAEAGT